MPLAGNLPKRVLCLAYTPSKPAGAAQSGVNERSSTSLPRWASGKACPAKAAPTTTLWRKIFSAASNADWFTCAGMTPAVVLKRIFSPRSRPFTIRCARIPRWTGCHRALLNCGCVMPLPPDREILSITAIHSVFLRFLLSIF